MQQRPSPDRAPARTRHLPRPAAAPERAAPDPAAEHEVAEPGTEHRPPLFTPPQLTAAAWDSASRRMVAKMLSEYCYEELLLPEPGSGSGSGSDLDAEAEAEAATDAPGTYWLRADPAGPMAGRRVSFRARRSAYGHWLVDPASPQVEAPAGRTERPLSDPVELLTSFRSTLGLSGDTTGHLIRELLATLSADARFEPAASASPTGPGTAADLADLDYAALEGHQTGHPWIVANKGRLGFSATDAEHWAPESRTARTLPWIAVHTDLADYRGIAGLEHPDALYARELDPPVLKLFRRTIARATARTGRNPEDYLLLPVHPWQWDETVAPLFAAEIASGSILALPTDNDLRLPQQSIRSFLNISRPDRHTVKLPLSVLNTLVWRGLPTERTTAAPAVTAWVQALRDADPYLREHCRVVLLGEVASVTVRHPVYDRLPEVPYQYRELLGAIWREPLSAHLDPHERPRTLAALLRTDHRGRSLTAELVARSGLTPADWLARLLAAILPPLLHFLYRYGVVFSPHGENAIVVFDEADIPVRLAVKDFVDDVNISAEPLPELAELPPEVDAVLLREPAGFLGQFIHSGLFVGVFRYLAPLMEEQLGLPEREFWQAVRAEIEAHHRRFPELAERHAAFDLLAPRIQRLCLNRNRLLLDGYRDRASRPHAAVHGTVPNPLAGSLADPLPDPPDPPANPMS